jgi:hypothetical protein
MQTPCQSNYKSFNRTKLSTVHHIYLIQWNRKDLQVSWWRMSTRQVMFLDYIADLYTWVYIPYSHINIMKRFFSLYLVLLCNKLQCLSLAKFLWSVVLQTFHKEWRTIVYHTLVNTAFGKHVSLFQRRRHISFIVLSAARWILKRNHIG